MKKEEITEWGAIILLAVMVLVLGYNFVVNPKIIIPEQLGAISEGDYKRLTTGHNQVVSYGPAILHSIVFGDGADQVYIGDVLSTALPSTNVVFQIDVDYSGVFTVETIFRRGIVANVTAANGATFIISPQ